MGSSTYSYSYITKAECMTFIQVWQVFALSSSHQHQSKKISFIDKEKENNKRDQQSNIKTQETLFCIISKIYILNIHKRI